MGIDGRIFVAISPLTQQILFNFQKLALMSLSHCHRILKSILKLNMLRYLVYTMSPWFLSLAPMNWMPHFGIRPESFFRIGFRYSMNNFIENPGQIILKFCLKLIPTCCCTAHQGINWSTVFGASAWSLLLTWERSLRGNKNIYRAALYPLLEIQHQGHSTELVHRPSSNSLSILLSDSE